jgi:hypothetical protein
MDHPRSNGFSPTAVPDRFPALRRPFRGRLALALAFGTALALTAQTPPGPASGDEADDVVVLSPFEIVSTQDEGYRATNTLAGTRLNTDIKDVGAAVSVYTAEFLADINVPKIEDILTYTASTEGGGMNGNYSGIVGDNSSGVRENPSGVNRVRALAQATRTRDFFPSDIPSDGFSFDSVTISRGPNAILAGVGSAGGVIDAAMRKATFANSYRLVSQFSEHGSHREEVHLNQVILPDRLAVRLDLLNDDKKFRQEPAYAEDQRLYAAMNYRVFEPKRGSFFGRGTLRANFETGNIEGTPPDPLTPVANLSSWFNDRNGVPMAAPLLKWSVNGATRQILGTDGTTVLTPAQTTNFIQGFPLYLQWALVYADPNSGVAGVGLTDSALAAVQGFQGTVPAAPTGPGGFVRGTGDINRQRPGFYRTHMTDPDIFDFYNNLLTGAFDRRKQDFDALDVRYEQLLLDGKAGIEAAYNKQSFTTARDIPIVNGDEADVYIDVNRFLSVRSAAYPNGIPNPNFGRPFVHTQDAFNDQVTKIDRESYQLTAFLKHDFTKSDSTWTQMLGRHTLSGLAFKTDIDRSVHTYRSTWDPAGQLNPGTTGQVPGSYPAQVNAWFYVGDSLINANSLADVRLQPIRSSRPEYGQTYTLQVYNNATRTFQTGTATPLRILGNLNDQRETVESFAISLQSHFFKNHLVTTVGWRDDQDDNLTREFPPKLPDGGYDNSVVSYRPSVSQSKQSWTKSVVGLLPVKLPGDTEIRAFWNESSNFNPVGQRRNIWNEELGSPSASTEEYGASITTFNGRLSLRIAHYRTEIENDAVSVANPYTYISTMIQRSLAGRDQGLNPADWNYPGFASFSDVALAFYDTIPERLKVNIGEDKQFYPYFTGSGPTLQWTPANIVNLTSTSDTVSEGMEYEAIINPTKGWRISLSVAENEAVKANVAVQELLFGDEWRNNIETMFEGRLVNGHRNPGTAVAGNDTFWYQYDTETLARIRSANAQSGTASPEIRRWRANLVTNYDFREGPLRGFNIGGAIRWQDKVGIGYPLIRNADNQNVSDIANPYWGPKEMAVDFSVGYTRKFQLKERSVTWRVNLNVRDIGAKEEIIPIQANADGSYGTFRIAPERAWTLTNSFAF